MIHELKTWKYFFEKVWQKQKPFEVRRNDRNYQGGDTIILREYDHKKELFTGRQIKCKASYILYGGSFGIEDDYCVIGLTYITLLI